MGFVFIFRSASGRRQADKLAKALRARGLDVCVGLEREPAEVRSSVSRALADHCSVMAALWTERDAEDAAFVEPMRHAATLGKLLALSPSGAQLPANLGPSLEVAHNWAGNASELASVCDALVQAASRNTPPGEGEGAAASEEYAAYQRMLRLGSVDAMARFLRAYPGGMFEEIVRAELDAATRPSYEPAQRARTGEGEPGQVWRMGEWTPWRALSGLSKLWPWAGAAALAVAVIALATLAPWSAVQTALETTRTAEAGVPPAQSPSASVRIEPAALEAQAAPIAPLETAAGAELTPVASPASVAQFEPAPIETPAPEPVQIAASPPPPASPQPQQSQPQPPVSTPAATPASARAYDVTQLDSALLEALERARRSETRALAAARGADARNVAPRANEAGVYHGQWSGDAANGQGRAVWANGDVYAGAWRASRPHGFGVLRLAGGLRYEGEFAEGAPTGQGVFWGADGRRLTGDGLFAALVRARTR